MIMRRLERRTAAFAAQQIAEWDVAHHRLRLKPDTMPEGDPDAA
jgi:hypothetical protein